MDFVTVAWGVIGVLAVFHLVGGACALVTGRVPRLLSRRSTGRHRLRGWAHLLTGVFGVLLVTAMLVMSRNPGLAMALSILAFACALIASGLHLHSLKPKRVP
ncbi:hypothetical protein GCM10010149_56650 [Nonomuraea roseoviolacea subsp. roseoviolacea]|uniref:hypothetical protein n=1 Tax=Nonomuraea roseoviolacea TaxID=103837 RepID=UPI0031D0B85D